MRTLLLSVLLVVLGQAHAEEAYTGKLLTRDGLSYKPFETEPFSGFYRYWYENGQLSKEATYKDGKKEGLHKSWYENRQLEKEATYKDGKKEELHKSWYEDGQLWWETTYKNGKPEGLYRVWYESGDLSKDATYKDGKKEGLFRQWWGKIVKETCYSNGEEVDMSNCQ